MLRSSNSAVPTSLTPLEAVSSIAQVNSARPALATRAQHRQHPPRRTPAPSASSQKSSSHRSARYTPRPPASQLRACCSSRLLVYVRRRCRASIELLALPRSTPRRRTSLLQRSSPARSRSSPRLLCRRARASAQGAPIRGCGVKPSGGPSSWPASGSARPPRLSPSSLPPPHPRRKARPARRPLDARSTPARRPARRSPAHHPQRGRRDARRCGRDARRCG